MEAIYHCNLRDVIEHPLCLSQAPSVKVSGTRTRARACSKPKQNGGVRRNMEKSGAVWESLDQPGGVQGDMERSGDARSKCGEGYVFYFDYKLESCPEAIELLYETSEIPE